MNTTITKGYRFLLLALIFIMGISAERVGLVEYYSDPWEQEYVFYLIRQHLYLVFVSMALAIATGLAVGIVMSRKKFKKYSGVVMYIVGLGQTIPSLAVLA
ncbi:MAG: ABC transporter permease, partial [Desulfonatronovibrio sp.]